MSDVDAASTITRLWQLHDQVQQYMLTHTHSAVQVGAMSLQDVLDTSAVAIGTLTGQAASFNSGSYSPFASPDEAWAAWSDVANQTAASLNSAQGNAAAWDVSHFAAAVVDQTKQNIGDAANSVEQAAAAPAAVLIVILVLVLAVKLA